MQIDILVSINYLDLVITECPINCDTCQQIWKNEVFCIKIICNAKNVIIKKILYWMDLVNLPIHIAVIKYLI